MGIETAKSGASVYVNLEDFHFLAVNFKAVEPLLYKELVATLKAAGMIVAEQAKQNASYAAKISGGIGVHMSGLAVYIGLPRTDFVAVEEYALGGWNHPVFGPVFSLPQVYQASHPYLSPALETKSDEVSGLIFAAVSEALDGAMDV
jgi:hypothetical protein